jgi:hypothetical protein
MPAGTGHLCLVRELIDWEISQAFAEPEILGSKRRAYNPSINLAKNMV